MTELWLVRHGQTDWNVEGRYQGQADMPLNAVGFGQARRLAEEMACRSYQAIFSSDLQRARQTAQALAARLGLPIRTDARLREIHQGEWEGRLVSELATIYGTAMLARRSDPQLARAPGGESVAEVAERVWAAANDIARAHPGGRAIVVSHGLALATLLARSRGAPLGQVYSLIPENASVTPIDWPLSAR